jgi:hypothetical protein
MCQCREDKAFGKDVCGATELRNWFEIFTYDFLLRNEINISSM